MSKDTGNGVGRGGARQRRYTEQEKQRAVRLILDEGKTAAEVERLTGVAASSATAYASLERKKRNGHGSAAVMSAASNVTPMTVREPIGLEESSPLAVRLLMSQDLREFLALPAEAQQAIRTLIDLDEKANS
jgi:transposase-like protein